MTLAENDKMVEALRSDCPYKSFCVWIAVGTAARYADAFYPVVAEHGAPSFGEKRVSVVDEVCGISEEPVTAVEEVAGNLLHPRFIGGDTDTGDVNPAGLQFHHEEDHVANGAEGAQGLDSEEVSRPGDFHPQALAEPYVNLSAHTAPIIQPPA